MPADEVHAHTITIGEMPADFGALEAAGVHTTDLPLMLDAGVPQAELVDALDEAVRSACEP